MSNYNGWISRTNWSAVVLVIVTMLQSVIPFMSAPVQAIVTSILGALIIIFHLKGITNAAAAAFAAGRAAALRPQPPTPTI